MTHQLTSYIAPAAPATRRPATGVLQYLRPEIGFTPKWYHKKLNIDFGEIWHSDPSYRKASVLQMREELENRFPGSGIGQIDEEESLDLLTGVFGACTVAAMFGVPIRYDKDQWPVSEHFNMSLDQVKDLTPADPGENPFFKELMAQVDWIAENEGKVHGFINWQGVLNNAHRLRGQDIFMDMIMYPEETKHLMQCITTTMIQSAQHLQNKQRESGVDYQFFTVSNCLVNMLSPDLYQEFVLPFDQQISDAFGSLGIHNCAWNADPYLNDYASVPKVGYIDMGIESDLTQARIAFPETRRALMYTPMDIANKSHQEIRSDMQLIADKYGPCDLVAADIEDGTPDEKVKDLLSICNEISMEYKSQKSISKFQISPKDK